MINKIKKFGEVVDKLTELVLKIGTLLAVVKMVVESLFK